MVGYSHEIKNVNGIRGNRGSEGLPLEKVLELTPSRTS